MNLFKKDSVSRNGLRRQRRYLTPLAVKTSHTLTDEPTSGVVLLPTWGILLEFKDVFSLCNRDVDVYDMYMHLEPKRIIESLIVSPDAYEALDIYDFIYTNYAGYASIQELHKVTDHIDHLYKAIHDKINKHLKVRHINDTYILHRWVGETTALIGAAQKKTTQHI